MSMDCTLLITVVKKFCKFSTIPNFSMHLKLAVLCNAGFLCGVQLYSVIALNFFFNELIKVYDNGR